METETMTDETTNTEQSPVAADCPNERLVMREMMGALEVAQTFCNSFTADECPDTVAIPINEAVNTARKYLGKSHFAKDGTLLNGDGSRSIFDDVDA